MPKRSEYVHEITLDNVPVEYINLMLHDLRGHSFAAPRFFERSREFRETDPEKAEENFQRGLKQSKKIQKLIDHFATRIDPKTGKMMLKARKIDVYDSIIAPILNDLAEEIFERRAVFRYVSAGMENELCQDRKIMYRINRNLLKNALDCGPGTEITYHSVSPVTSLDDDEPVDDGKYSKQIISNTIPDAEFEKEEGLGMGLKLVRSMINFLGGSCIDDPLQIYASEGEKLRHAKVEYIVPTDLTEHYKTLGARIKKKRYFLEDP